MRRVLLIVLALVVLIAIGLGIYFFFFANKGTGIVVTPPDLFGGSDTYQGAPVDGPALGEEITSAVEEVAPNFVKITDGPVALGAVAFGISEVRSIQGENATTTATTTIKDTEVRYVEKETGNVYAYRVNARTLTRLTNETLPGIQEASWMPDGSLVYLRFLSSDVESRIQTYAFPVSGVDGYFLEANLDQVVVTGSSTAITLLPSANGSTATLAKADGSVVRTLFSSPLSSLHIAPAGNSVVAYTKPSASVRGYGFLVNTAGGFEAFAGPQAGLSLLPNPSGKTVLSSYRQGNAIRLELIDSATKAVISLPLSTLAEKCVWAKDGSTIYCAAPRALPQGLPDSWYQGSVSFSDRIWKISVADRVAVLIVDPREIAEVEIDAIHLTLDGANDTLTFTNKKDGSLWLYDL